MKELKIGDEVRIRKDLKAGEKYGKVLVVPQMLKYCGKRATIYKAFSCRVLLNEFGFCWTPEMFEPISKLKEKLIFRDDATILIKDGKEYVTKCDKNDTYDREKGLLVVLAKANGYNYNDIQEMLKSAEIQNKKVTEVKRVARMGEYVKIINAEKDSDYKNGDIFRIVSDYKGRVRYGNLFGQFLHNDEYVVLENYQPLKQEQ